MDLGQEAQEEEVAVPQEDEYNTQASDAQEQEQEENQDQEEGKASDDQDRNWKALRTKAEEAERRSQEYEKQLQEYQKLVKEIATGKAPQKQEEPEPEEDFDENDIPTYGQTRKAIQREAQRIAKETIEKTLKEKEYSTAPKRLTSEFSDFDDIVTKKNVDYLIENEPEIADTLRATKDPYKQGKIAYKFIKSLGIVKEPNTKALKEDANANLKKPVSTNAVSGRNSLNNANVFSKGLTADLKKQLWKEMNEAAGGL